jgi:hypothetical protein
LYSAPNQRKIPYSQGILAMSEMVERVAKAIEGQMGGKSTDMARAAIMAMRAIFEEMQATAEFQADREYELYVAVEVIDEALNLAGAN